MTTVQELARITAKHNEIVKRVVRGSLDADSVCLALQAIIEKREPRLPKTAAPAWYRSPEQQLERVRLLAAYEDWNFTPGDYPPVPEGLEPPSPNALLMLDVKLGTMQQTFEALWRLIPCNGHKVRNDELNAGWGASPSRRR